MQDIYTRININGYAQIGHHIDMKNKTGSTINVLGALYILGDGIKNTSGCSLTVTAAPMKSALQIWTDASSQSVWSPAGGAFYKNIQR